MATNDTTYFQLLRNANFELRIIEVMQFSSRSIVYDLF